MTFFSGSSKVQNLDTYPVKKKLKHMSKTNSSHQSRIQHWDISEDIKHNDQVLIETKVTKLGWPESTC